MDNNSSFDWRCIDYSFYSLLLWTRANTRDKAKYSVFSRVCRIALIQDQGHRDISLAMLIQSSLTCLRCEKTNNVVICDPIYSRFMLFYVKESFNENTF